MQQSIFVWLEVPDFPGSTYIYLAIGSQSQGTDGFGSRGGIMFPETAIKSQKSFIITHINDPLFILDDAPVGGSGIISLFGIIDNIGQSDSVLGTCLQRGQKQG